MTGKGQLRVRITGDDSDLKSTLGSAGGAIGKFGAAAATAVGAAVGFSVKKFADFDQALNESVAIMGDVSDSMRKDMSDAAREVGKTTKFSAEQAAESYFFLASAGLDAKQSIAALPQVAAFAQAGNFDMALATDLLTDSQSALGLSTDDAAKNLENMTRVSDVFVKANTLANTSVEQLANAFTNKAGAALRAANKDVEEGAAVLAAFADQGIKGQKAGESLSIVLRDLTSAAVKNGDKFAELGVEVLDADGNLRNMADIVASLETGLHGMSDAERVAALQQMGLTQAAGDAVTNLLGTSDAIREYEKELRSAGGMTQEVADKQLDTFWAQLGLLKDQLIDVALGIGERLMPHIRSFVDLLQRNMPAIQAFVDRGLSAIGTVVRDIVIPAIREIISVGRRVVEWFRSGQDSASNLTDAFKSIGATLASFLPQLQDIGRRIVEVLVPALQMIWSKIQQLIPAFADFFAAIRPGLEFLLGVVGDALVGAFKGLVQAVQGAFDIIIGLLDTFTGIFTGDWSRAWKGIKQIGQGIWDLIVGAFKVFWNIGILKFIRAGLKLLGNIVKSGWKFVQDLFRRAWKALTDNVKSGVRTAVDRIKGFKDSIVSFFKSAGRWLVRGGKAVVRGLLDGAKAIWRVVRTWLGNRKDSVKGFFSGAPNWLISAGKNILKGLKAGLSFMWASLQFWFVGIPIKIIGAFRGAGSWLWSAGQSIIDGLWGGIQSGFGKIKDGLGWLGNQLTSWKGPESFDRKVLRGAGQSIITGLDQGLRDKFGMIRNTLGELTDDIATSNSPRVAVDSMVANANDLDSRAGGTSAGGQSTLTLRTESGADSAFATFLQGMIRKGQIRLVDSNGKPVRVER